jgi:arylsulfatase A-like enzyme
MLTGRYVRAHRSFTNGFCLLPRETDLPTLLREHGYHTAIVGKDHCYGGHRIRDVFDHVRLAGHSSFETPLDVVEEQIGASRKGTMQAPFAEDPVPGDDGITARLCRDAVDYVVDADRQTPWFMWLSIPEPHPPYMVGAPYDTMYADTEIPPPAWTEDEMATKPYRQQLVVDWDRYGAEYPGELIDRLRQIYWGMVTCIDTHVGKVLRALETQGVDDDTIVIFTSDHGDYMGDHRMVRKGPHVYEALTHVPLIMRWGDRFAPRTTDAFVSNVDFYPTLCDLVGVETPPQVQGISQAAFLRDGGAAPRQAVFTEHGSPGAPLTAASVSAEELAAIRDNPGGHHLCAPIYRGRSRGVRSDRWKYVCNVGDVDELYDLEADPNELVNRVADPSAQDALHAHRELLLEWAIDTEDPLQAVAR